MTTPTRQRKPREEETTDDDEIHEERDVGELEPGEPGDGRIIRKRLED